MFHLLLRLDANDRVLDLGSNQGSFPSSATAARVFRCDLDRPASGDRAGFVQSDAARLPFADRSFQLVISNHSLEHFVDLDNALTEIGRVLRPEGCLYIAVPDASTLSDKLYRSLSNGGGHVNAFTSPKQVVTVVERATSLKHVATRLLCASLSIMNRRNAPEPRPRRLLLLGGGSEWSLFLYAFLSRRCDRLFGTRTSVYGWAFYFGNTRGPVDTQTWNNVCIRCGAGVPTKSLTATRLLTYRCPNCGAVNPYTEDRHETP